jgi:hypothetical protein
MHTYLHATFYPRKDSRGITDIPPRHRRFTKMSAMRNASDVTGGKLDPLFAIRDIPGKEGEVLFYSSGPNTTRDLQLIFINIGTNFIPILHSCELSK